MRTAMVTALALVGALAGPARAEALAAAPPPPVQPYLVTAFLGGAVGGPSTSQGLTARHALAIVDLRLSVGLGFPLDPMWRLRVGLAGDLAIIAHHFRESGSGLYSQDLMPLLGLEAEIERSMPNGWRYGGRVSGSVGSERTGQWITVGGRARKGGVVLAVDAILARQATDFETSKGYGALVGVGVEGRRGGYVLIAEASAAAILGGILLYALVASAD